ncbi:hypothetical protein PENANT_c020G06751 [Penicillium antarcticum]|uniref:Uncharacterized protein n=1 Tax=Penicillium antarcticum TaxID=416450 RepID=A0A1V6Q0L7_9EURO|nr:hypothetical protein PENANT_c020G06751 [Penicillium antarcticum]
MTSASDSVSSHSSSRASREQNVEAQAEADAAVHISEQGASAGMKHRSNSISVGSSISQFGNSASIVVSENLATMKGVMMDDALPRAQEALQTVGGQIQALTNGKKEPEESTSGEVTLTSEEHECIDTMDNERPVDTGLTSAELTGRDQADVRSAGSTKEWKVTVNKKVLSRDTEEDVALTPSASWPTTLKGKLEKFLEGKTPVFVECRFTTRAIALPISPNYNWPRFSDTSELDIRGFEKTFGILWIMTKREDMTASESALESKICFSTSEYAQVPPRATDLVAPLV